jgi:hypothetical protein
MMREVKRINLSFDLRNEKLREAYGIIVSKRSAKTAFVADAVLAYLENNTLINKQCIKEAVCIFRRIRTAKPELSGH